MGCGSSKQKQCRNCQTSLPRLRRSQSSLHSPASFKESAGVNHHVISRTSSLMRPVIFDQVNPEVDLQTDHDLSLGSLKSKLDSLDHSHQIIKQESLENNEEIREKIDVKVPRILPQTPTKTPSGEPEVINAWELMEGLDDVSPIKAPLHYARSFSFHFSSYQSLFDDDLTPNLLHKRMPSLGCKDHNFEMITHDSKKQVVKEKVVVYFTSLRGVRKTYEDCCDVRMILKGLGVKVDERDVSMHLGFRNELKYLIGEGWILPKVFVGRRCIGGAEEIRRMHEEGELKKAVDGVALADHGAGGGVCEVCGDARFVPCDTCFGSCRVYHEGEYGKSLSGFRRCHGCNENGLIRCPMCSSDS